MEQNRPEELVRADMLLHYFKKAPSGIYPVTEQQVELIKTWWWELHRYCGAEFTFNESYNKIKKL